MSIQNAHQRRAVVAPIVAVTFVVLIGFAALAVDMGMVYNGHAEMQNVADAGALAGAGQLENGESAAISTAQATATRNGVSGSLVSASELSIEVGNWHGVKLEFTPPAEGDVVTPNAVRVIGNRIDQSLYFARILGINSTDIDRGAVATLGSGKCLGVWGLEGISGTGNISTDSFNSDEGLYGTGNIYANGDICSNQDVGLSGSVEIRGDVMFGEGYDIDISGGSYDIWGVVDDHDNAFVPPDVDMNAAMLNNDNDSIGLTDEGRRPFKGNTLNLSIEGTDNLTLDPGTYYFTSAKLVGTATITVTGPTEIYVSGDAHFGGGGIINVTKDPENLMIYSSGAQVDVAGSAGFYGTVIAPQSELNLVGGGQYYGVLIGQTLIAHGDSEIHVDESVVQDIWGEDSVAPALVQ